MEKIASTGQVNPISIMAPRIYLYGRRQCRGGKISIFTRFWIKKEFCKTKARSGICYEFVKDYEINR